MDELYAAAFDLLDRERSRDRAEPFPGRVWQTAADSDWFRILASEAEGGLGLGYVELGAVFRAVGRRLFTGPLLDQAVHVPALLGGRPEHADLLAACLAGRAIVVLARPIAAPYATDVVRFANGHLSGSVDLVPYATHASRIAVVAESGDEPCVVLVDAAECVIDPVESRDPSEIFGRLVLNSATGDVLVSGADARRLLDRTLAVDRLMLAAELAGVAAELTDLAVEYAKQREQFGRPIGGFQAIRHILAEMAGRVAGLESLVTVSLMDADASPDRLARLGMSAKIHASTVVRSVAHQALQVHGAIGFTTELPMHRYFWRAMSGQARFGEADAIAVELGHRVLAGATV